MLAALFARVSEHRMHTRLIERSASSCPSRTCKREPIGRCGYDTGLTDARRAPLAFRHRRPRSMQLIVLAIFLELGNHRLTANECFSIATMFGAQHRENPAAYFVLVHRWNAHVITVGPPASP